MTDKAGGRFYGVDRGGGDRQHLSEQQRRPLLSLRYGRRWRCVNCKDITAATREPEQCGSCRCRHLVRVDD